VFGCGAGICVSGNECVLEVNRACASAQAAAIACPIFIAVSPIIGDGNIRELRRTIVGVVEAAAIIFSAVAA
jgi:hypothetical protein